MIKIAITGASGLIGKNLSNNLKYIQKSFDVVEISKSDFDDDNILDKKISNANFVIHLAAVCRDTNQENLYNQNIFLTKKIISSLSRINRTAHIIFASSTHEKDGSSYGKSKFDSRNLFIEWSNENNTNFHGLIIPNTFGPFGKPFHNSVVSTFCHQLINEQECKINNNAILNLLYVDDLVYHIIQIIKDEELIKKEEYYIIKNVNQIELTDLYNLLKKFKDLYYDQGIIPYFENKFQLSLFNTFRSYIPIEKYFPRIYTKHNDERGNFIELLKLKSGGQVSFSTTRPNITRGNHFHTRKIERFMILKGEAIVELRKVDSTQKFTFKLSGENPSYIDMPIWYTHNLKNIGKDELITVFWINEFFDINDPDTFSNLV